MSDAQQPDTLGLVSMVCGILSIVFYVMGCVFGPFGMLALVLAPVALVTGLMSRRQVAETGGDATFGTVGLITGAITIVLWLVLFLLMLLMLFGFGALIVLDSM